MNVFELFETKDLNVIFISVLVFLALHFAGRAFFGSKAFRPLMPLIGLVFVYFIFVFGSLLSPGMSLFVPFIFLLFLGLIGVLRSPSEAISDLFLILISLIPIVPLLIIAACAQEPQWDDMTHWLVFAKFMFVNGHLPTIETPIFNVAHPYYPYTRAMLHSWVSLIYGDFTINVQPIFNCLFLSSLFLWLAEFVQKIEKRDVFKNEQIIFVFLSCSLVVPWVVFVGSTQTVSSYADPIYSIFFVHLFQICLFTFDNSDTEHHNHKLHLLQCGLVILGCSMIKDTGVFLSLIMIASLLILNMTTQKIKNKDLNILANLRHFKTLVLVFSPTVIFTALWKMYLTGVTATGGKTIAIPENWNFKIIDEILISSVTAFQERPYVIIVMVLLLGGFVSNIFFFKSKPIWLTRMTLLSVTFFIGLFLLHIMAYCLAFTSGEAGTAASLTRYLAPAGLVMTMALLFLSFEFLKGRGLKFIFCISLLVLLSTNGVIILAADKLVPEKKNITSLLNISQSIKHSYPSGKRLILVDTETNGFSPTLIRYNLDWHMNTTYRSFKKNEEVSVIIRELDKVASKTDYFYLLNGSNFLYEYFGITAQHELSASIIEDNCEQNKKLLLLDLETNGKNSRKIEMLFKGKFLVTVRSKIDWERSAGEVDLNNWISKSDCSFVITANGIPELANEYTFKNM